MIICVTCVMEMKCTKTGIGVDYGNGHVYSGDRFQCENCGADIIHANNSSYHDPEYKSKDVYLNMDTGQLRQSKI